MASQIIMDPEVRLANLVICSHLISKPSERRLAMSCTEEPLENLKMIRELSEMICPRYDFEKISDRVKQFKERADAARLYLDQSTSIIPFKDTHSTVTYADVGKMVDRVLQPKYTTMTRTAFDVTQSKVVVFWDIISCPIPEDFGGDDLRAIPGNIGTALETGGYRGEREIYVVGDHGLSDSIVKSWSVDEVKFIPSSATALGKETASKTMILSASGWLYHHLRENGQEPCVLLAITQDRNFRFVINLAKGLEFLTLIARERKGHWTLQPDEQIQSAKLVRGVWELLP